jgi:hypothetical protein
MFQKKKLGKHRLSKFLDMLRVCAGRINGEYKFWRSRRVKFESGLIMVFRSTHSFLFPGPNSTNGREGDMKKLSGCISAAGTAVRRHTGPLTISMPM